MSFPRTQAASNHRNRAAPLYNRSRIHRSVRRSQWFDSHLGDRKAHLVVIHAHVLGVDRRAQVQAGNQVDRLCEYHSHDESVCAGSADVRNLDVELLPVVVEPAARVCRIHIIECDNPPFREKRIENKADDPT